jgi:hypothetical protein
MVGDLSLKALSTALTIGFGVAAVACTTATAHVPGASGRPTPAATQQESSRVHNLNRSVSTSIADEAVVRVVSRGVGCSGTLITNNLVLTAHHCMVERGAEGEILDQDLPAGELEVEVGGDFHPLATVPVAAAVAPPCGYRGGQGDIAVLVLSHRVVGMHVMPVRLSDPPRTGEPIEPLGFGRCALSAERARPTRHDGGPVEELNPFSLSASASICPGDSGGPARSRITGEAIGVVSAGVMDDSDQTRDTASFTRLDVWRSLFLKAQLIADGSAPAEAPPVSGCEREDGMMSEAVSTSMTRASGRPLHGAITLPSARLPRHNAMVKAPGAR